MLSIISRIDGFVFQFLNNIKHLNHIKNNEKYHVWHCIKVKGLTFDYKCYCCGQEFKFNLTQELYPYFKTQSCKIEDKDEYNCMLNELECIIKRLYNYTKYYGNTIFDINFNLIKEQTSEIEEIYENNFDRICR